MRYLGEPLGPSIHIPLKISLDRAWKFQIV